jgi:hypothetical protein
MRSDLWNPDKQVSRDSLPSNGAMLSAFTRQRVDAAEFDRAEPARLRETLY